MIKKPFYRKEKEKEFGKGLYQFPLIERDKSINKNELISSEEFNTLFPTETTISLFNTKEIVHKLSHQHIHTQFWVVKTNGLFEGTIAWSEIEKFPVPVLIANFLEEYLK